jgi:hypothetical protein
VPDAHGQGLGSVRCYMYTCTRVYMYTCTCISISLPWRAYSHSHTLQFSHHYSIY